MLVRHFAAWYFNYQNGNHALLQLLAAWLRREENRRNMILQGYFFVQPTICQPTFGGLYMSNLVLNRRGVTDFLLAQCPALFRNPFLFKADPSPLCHVSCRVQRPPFWAASFRILVFFVNPLLSPNTVCSPATFFLIAPCLLCLPSNPTWGYGRHFE